MELLQNFYETTLDALRDAKNERLWFKTMTKLGKLYFDRCCTCFADSFNSFILALLWNLTDFVIFSTSGRSSTGLLGFWSSCARVVRPRRGRMTSRKAPSCLRWLIFKIFVLIFLHKLHSGVFRCMPSRSRCTQHRRTTRSWRPCTTRASTYLWHDRPTYQVIIPFFTG